MTINAAEQARIIPLRHAIVENFNREKWLELGLLTGFLEEIRSHPRLLRSWDFGDDDYSGHVLDMIVSMVARDLGNLDIIERYVLNGTEGTTLLQEDGRKRVMICPREFNVPNEQPNPRLVAVMMPFDAGFTRVYEAIKAACASAGMDCERVDNVWEHSAIIQDVFGLIWKSSIVVCDFTGRNPNVFYECGIAHTLGRHVIPLAQHKTDVPFDLQHHRYLPYQSNGEGLSLLSDELSKRLRTLSAQS
jgi:hypothetical protein